MTAPVPAPSMPLNMSVNTYLGAELAPGIGIKLLAIMTKLESAITSSACPGSAEMPIINAMK